MDRQTKKINVLHIMSSFEVGGNEKTLVSFLKNFSADDKKISFVTVIMNDLVNEDIKNELIQTGHPVYFFNRKRGHKHPKYLFKLLKIISEHNINIIHSYTFGGKFWSILCKIIKPELKLVFNVADTNLANRYNRFHKFLHNMIIDINIAVSKSIENECKNAGIKPVSQIYHGLNFSNFHPKENLIKDDTFKIINLARITHSKKGQDILIKALKECKDCGLKIKCSFIGRIQDDDLTSINYLKNLVKELNLENEVEFPGNRNDVSELLSQSDLFVLPSRYEGLGMVILEAMAAGIPVIASNIDGPAELIRSGKNGILFENENYTELAEKIMFLYNNPDERARLAKNGLNFVQDFDILTMCTKYHELYKDILDKGMVR